MTKPIEAGTVIAGTLRSEDLLEAFAGELETIDILPAHKKLIFEAQNRWYLDDGTDERWDEVPEIVNELIDALNTYAPAGMYFGTLEGDGADFGWWYVAEESEVTA